MNVTYFCLFINCLSTAIMFGLWQKSVTGGLFVMLFLGSLLSMIDYMKKPAQRK